MLDDSVTRRGVLRSVAAGGAAVMGVGTASAEQPDSRIVGTASPRAERAAERRADRVDKVLDFGQVGKAVVGRFSEQAAENLRRRRDVRYVEENGRMHALAQTLPWGIDRVDADVLHDNGETGNGADVAILDTGIDSDHYDLADRIQGGRCFTADCCGEAGGLFCSPNDNECHHEWDDDHDHGTHCAGIADAVDDAEGVVGVSPEATLWAGKVLDGCGSGSYDGIADGIRWAADQGHDVASMSLGGDDSSVVQDACQYAYDAGVLLVAAAGNDGECTDCVGYPAAYDTVVAVSATSEDDSLASFSSTGPEVELAAPGEDVLSTVPPESSSDGLDTFSGTSMACPHVSGAGGQLMANGYSNTEARQRLRDTAEDIGLSDNEQGYGLLDAEAAVLDGSSDSAPSVSWVNPTDGDTVSGTVTVQIDASDSEDGDDSLDVTYTVDGGSSRSTTYNSTSGYYEDSWDTTGVADGDHSLEATATDSAGNSSSSAITVTVDNTESALAVSTGSATNVGETSATLNGSLDDLGGADSADCYFEYRESGSSSWTATTAQTLTSTGSYSEDVSGLSSGTDYEFRAVADASDGDSDTGATNGFTTDSSSGDTAPVVDSYTVTEAGSPNPHAEITADWAVSDADGDLDTVVVEVFDSGGTLVDSSTTDVSGSAASGSDEFKIKHADGETFDVTLTVTDAAGNSASETQSVTA